MRHFLIALVLLLVAFSSRAAEQPNVLIILADDLGYADLGCYGSEIATPNLDSLAARGIRFTQFYNTARCWPTRAALMTGLYPHQARMAMNYGETAPPAYTGFIPADVPLLSERLRPLGYRSYHSGKWHLASRNGKSNLPLERGFDRSYYIVQQDNYFFPKSVLDDAQPVKDFPADYYATDAIASKTIEHLRQHNADHAGKPFLAYVAFTAPHFPLHAPAETIAKYRGKYRAGWDVLRARRFERMKQLGVYSGELSPRDSAAPAWASLSDAEKDLQDARMAIHAAMIDRMDQQIGRILDELRAMNVFDNTLILFLSDNGASAESLVRGEGHDPAAPPGSRKSYLCLEVGWSNVSNTPFRQHKIWVHEGGAATPLIAHWPKGITAPAGSFNTWAGHVIDIVPTVMALNGKENIATPGRSFADAFKGGMPPAHDFLFWEHVGNAAIRQGDWKLVRERNQPWELYNLAADRVETHNLAAREPQRARELESLWQREADRQGVVPPEKLAPAGKGLKNYKQK